MAAVPKGRVDPRDMMGREQRTLLVLSGEEKTIATVDFADGKLSLPQPIAIDGEPVAIAVDGSDAIALVDRGSRTKDYHFITLSADDAGSWTADDLTADAKALGLSKDEVTSMQTGDFDDDGHTDLLLTIRRSPAIVLFGTGNTDDDAAFEARDSDGFTLPTLDPQQITIQGRKLLATQSRYARLLEWKDNGWRVTEQINAPSSGAKIDLLRLSDGPDARAIVDNTSDLLWLSDAEGHINDEVELGSLNVLDLAMADVDGDRKPDLLMLSPSRVGVLGTRPDRRELQTVATYERDDDDAYFGDVIAGDFNSDGLTDLIINETGEHTLEIAAIAPDPTEILKADRFKLFEQKSFQGDSASGGEPREMLAADVTGDGRVDLVLLMEDRLLVFPQDSND